MGVGYAAAYRLGLTPWERAGEEGDPAFQRLLDREEQERSRPLGRALDLGCGRGAHTAQLAQRGWEAVGVDNVALALEKARDRHGGTAGFVRADVTDLGSAGLEPGFGFFLDIGCFHGLDERGRLDMGRGVTALAAPEATLLLLCFRPNRTPFLPRGADQADLVQAFAGWQVVEVEAADTAGMPAPLRRLTPQWYRLRLQ